MSKTKLGAEWKAISWGETITVNNGKNAVFVNPSGNRDLGIPSAADKRLAGHVAACLNVRRNVSPEAISALLATAKKLLHAVRSTSPGGHVFDKDIADAVRAAQAAIAKVEGRS